MENINNVKDNVKDSVKDNVEDNIEDNIEDSVEDNIQLNEKQQKAYDMMINGDNVLITSSAGCGKTVTIKHFYLNHFTNIDKTIGKVALCSTTVISALLINGVTLHSYL